MWTTLKRLIGGYYGWLVFMLSIGWWSGWLYLLRNFMTNFDEYDHLAVGYLLSAGRNLYTDIFSHHFPLPYYWTALFSGQWENLPVYRMVSVFRLSVLVLYGVVLLLLCLVNKQQRTRLLLSGWVGLLAIWLSLYHGNLVLSETFAAVFLSGVAWLVLPVLLGWEQMSRIRMWFLMVLAAGGVWTQPLLGGLLFIPLFLEKVRIREWFNCLVAVIGLPVLLLLITGQFGAFWEQAVMFNQNVYLQYYFELYGQNSGILATGWNILRNQWYWSTHFSSPIDWFQAAANASFLLLVGMMVKRKYWRAVAVLGLLFASARAREVKIVPGEIFNFGVYPYMMLGTISTFLLWGLFKEKLGKILVMALILILTISAGISVKPIVAQSLSPGYNYHVFWSWRQELGEDLAALSKPEEKILVYPHDVDLYAFAKREPIDTFLYWFPWIDQVDKYRSERLHALSQTPPPVIYVGGLGFKEDDNYYAQFFPDLLANYKQISKQGVDRPIWVRVDLQERVREPYSLVKSKENLEVTD